MEPTWTCESVADVRRSLMTEPPVPQSRSVPALRLDSLGSGYASDIAQPGGFRRAFIGHSGPPAQFHLGFLRQVSRASAVYGTMAGAGREGMQTDDGYIDLPDSTPGPGMSVPVTTVTFFKSMIGPTMLYVPCMYLEAGFCVASAGLCVSAALSTVGMYKLVQVSQVLQRSNATYSDIGQLVFGRRGYLMVEICLVTSQWLYCVGYPIFVAQNLHAVFGAFREPPSVASLIVLQLPLVIPYCWVRQIQKLGRPMILSNSKSTGSPPDL